MISRLEAAGTSLTLLGIMFGGWVGIKVDVATIQTENRTFKEGQEQAINDRAEIRKSLNQIDKHMSSMDANLVNLEKGLVLMHQELREDRKGP